MLNSVAALFVRERSVYHGLHGVECFPDSRDARTFKGGMPVIAHPPCAPWGRLRHFSRRSAEERGLAVWAVDTVRKCGGVLEHPASSLLWSECGLPFPGEMDAFGFTISVSQSCFGHRADKLTWLYVCHVSPSDIPAIRPVLSGSYMEVTRLGRAAREATPLAMAEWLVALAKSSSAHMVTASGVINALATWPSEPG